jgi:hypothetical protein
MMQVTAFSARADAAPAEFRQAGEPGRVWAPWARDSNRTGRRAGDFHKTLSPGVIPYLYPRTGRDCGMGRSFLSVRQGVNHIADRWERSAKKWKRGKEMAGLAKKYASESFMGCNDPLEGALFSAMVECRKRGPDHESQGLQDGCLTPPSQPPA